MIKGLLFEPEEGGVNCYGFCENWKDQKIPRLEFFIIGPKEPEVETKRKEVRVLRGDSRQKWRLLGSKKTSKPVAMVGG